MRGQIRLIICNDKKFSSQEKWVYNPSNERTFFLNLNRKIQILKQRNSVVRFHMIQPEGAFVASLKKKVRSYRHHAGSVHAVSLYFVQLKMHIRTKATIYIPTTIS
jgi:hypothetical protein